MEAHISSIINDKNMSQACRKKEDKFKTIKYALKNRTIKASQKNSKVINFILFVIISILLPKTIISKNYMEITVNQEGYNQIISDEYRDDLPTKVLVNDIPILMINKKVFVESLEHLIYLEWPDNKNNINVSCMFSNITSIKSVSMHILEKSGDFSYMFYNCQNLENFTYGLDRHISRSIHNMKYMFYNCSSLKSFDFKKFYINYYRTYITYYYINTTRYSKTNYDYYYVNLSSMFYNCRSLQSVDFGSDAIKYITDMKRMFYNCFSLTSINLRNIYTNNDIDLSYMFYNCSVLEIFSINSIYIKDMEYMFYNCNSLKNIDLNAFSSYYSYYVNMSYTFYNCYNLKTIQNFGYLYISDTREMLYNCSSLLSLSFNPRGTINNINMTKMFFNCTSLITVTLNSNNYYYIYPNDLSYTFYNCTSLTTLIFNYFKTDNLLEITYMMFNCEKLSSFSLSNSNFSNSITKNMRGVFQNCKSIITLDLSTFYTPKVEIMWDMFKDCSKLKVLKIQNFNTSNVIDMESMFEGCSSIVSLSLTNFRTPKVHYMNKMFSGCTNLETLVINYIKSDSLGTMHQMFYNCQNLKYLNIYSLTENDQSIIEMFEEASNNIQFCVKETENIPKIYEELKKRGFPDCTANCYGSGYSRVSIPEKKLCCPHVQYNGFCYDSCPPRTSQNEARECKNFTCANYYDYTQSGCLTSIPNGYYLNDTQLKTIDKCPPTCTSCKKDITDKYVHCLSCIASLPYLYFGNCTNLCPNGIYPNSLVPTCRCVTNECSDCSEESLEKGLCISCSEGYFTKSGEVYDNNYKKCYKDPPKYYYDSSAGIYKPCFSSCYNCIGAGDKYNHKCISCDINYNFSLVQSISGIVTKNCYEECDYYYYFDQLNNYNCTNAKQCPPDYKFLIVELGQCVSTCSNNQLGYVMRLRKECYKECPVGISKKSEIIENLCEVICPYDAPFELVEEETCVSSCSIMERSEKKCITNNMENRTNLQIQEIIYDDIISDLTSKFNYSIITDNYSVIIEENSTVYEIISTRNQNKNNLTSNIDFGRCESLLKEYYDDISENDPLYIFKMDAYLEGKIGPTVVYEVFYPLDSGSLSQLDISICEGEKISISYYKELENPELYDKNNPIYTDICHPYSSIDGLDMTLSSKQKDYANNNKSLCEEDCEYMGYDKLELLIKCNCDIKDSSTVISGIKVDKSKLYNFMSIDKLANFDVLKCINLVIKKEYLIANFGFYSFIPTFIFYFISVIIFYAKEFKSVKGDINNMVEAKKMLEYLKAKRERLRQEQLNGNKYIWKKPAYHSFFKKKKNYKKQTPMRLNNKLYNVLNNKTVIFGKDSSIRLKQNSTIDEKITEEDNEHEHDSSAVKLRRSNNIINVNNIHNDIVIMKKKAKNAPPLKTQININKKSNNDNLSIFPIKKSGNTLTQKFNFRKRNFDYEKAFAEIEKEENKMRIILRKNDKELNELNFKIAVKFDNRTFWQFYFSLLKTEHLLFKIINSRDFNSRSIKIYLFLYNFGLSYAVNGLFFDDEAIDAIFAEGGKFNLINQIPQIIYSSIISFCFCVILDFLALPEDNILDIKKGKVAKIVEKNAKGEMKMLQIKFIFFYILSFLFMLVCWYYMTCFCAVYRNTQYHLLKDTLIGFGTSMLSPFATKLIPGFFRIYGIRKRSQIFFRISQFIQVLI